MKSELLYLIVATECISVFLFIRILKSNDYLFIKVLLGLLVFIPIVGPIFYFFSAGMPKPLPIEMQNRSNIFTNVPMKGHYTDIWQDRIKRMQDKINELTSAGMPNDDAWKAEITETQVGIHILYPDFEHEQVSTSLDWSIIRSSLRKLDWEKNFYHFILVKSPGLSFEVSGSLNGLDGLSAAYRDRQHNIEIVTDSPPESIEDIELLLSQFLETDYMEP